PGPRPLAPRRLRSSIGPDETAIGEERRAARALIPGRERRQPSTIKLRLWIGIAPRNVSREEQARPLGLRGEPPHPPNEVRLLFGRRAVFGRGGEAHFGEPDRAARGGREDRV